MRFTLNENASGIFDFLAELEDKVPVDVKQTLVYTAGYVVCQWAFFCFIVFEVVKHVVCRSSLHKLFMEISEFYAFYVPNQSFQILANSLLKNFCIHGTPLPPNEVKQKVLKLGS